MKRYAKLISPSEFTMQMVEEKGYREKDVKLFMKDLTEVLVENLSVGNSVHLLPGLFLEVMQHPGQTVYSFKEKKNVKQDPYPILYCRLTDSLKDRVYAREEEVENKDDRYGYDDDE